MKVSKSQKYVVLEGGLGNILWQFAFSHLLSKEGFEVTLIFLENDGKGVSENLESARIHIEQLVSVCSHGIRLEKAEIKNISNRRWFIPESNYASILPCQIKRKDFRNNTYDEILSHELRRNRVFHGYFQHFDYLESEVKEIGRAHV